MIRILSDLHLGHRSCRIQNVGDLEPLLEGVSTLLVNGDGCEQLAPVFIPRSRQMWEELVQLCARRGVALDAVRGNHDPKTPGQPFREFCDGKVFVHHGDAIYPTVSPWSREVWRHRHFINAFIAEHWRDDFDRSERFDFARRLELAIPQIPHPRSRVALFRLLRLFAWPPHRPFLVIKTWLEAPRKVLAWSAQYAPGARLVICGHFHRPACFRASDGRHAWLTGPFTAPANPTCIDLEPEKLRARMREIGQAAKADWQAGKTLAELQL